MKRVIAIVLLLSAAAYGGWYLAYLISRGNVRFDTKQSSENQVAPEVVSDVTSPRAIASESTHSQPAIAGIAVGSIRKAVQSDSPIVNSSSPVVEAMIAKLREPNLDPGDARTLMIALEVAGRVDERVTSAMMEYVVRPVDWSTWSQPRSVPKLHSAKKSALVYLGKTRTPEAQRFLLRAITPEGASSLTKAWLPSMPEYRPLLDENATADFRGNAASGLSYFGDQPEVYNLIASEYQAERQRLIGLGRVSGMYYNELVSAMVKMDMIRDLGLDKYESLNQETRLQLSLEYSNRGHYHLPQ